MKKLIIWIIFLLVYVMGISSLVLANVLINRELVHVSLLIHGLEILILLLMGMGLAYFINGFYQRDAADPLLSNWQMRPTLYAVGYGLLMLGATIVYDDIRQLFGLPAGLPENQQILFNIMQETPLQLIVDAAIVAPVLEELLFRGTLYHVLAVKWRQAPYFICISAGLFAALHTLPTNLDFIIYAVMGAILAQCYLHTRQLKYAILAHTINNAITLTFMWHNI